MKRSIGLVLTLILLWGSSVSAENNYNWIEGGKKISLGSMATVDLNEEFTFLDGADTIKLQRDWNFKPSGKEIGSIHPLDENQNWVVYFEYEESGHIYDDEKKKIDANAILKSYKDGSEEANKELEPESRLYVAGWDVEPFYDDKTHNLTWSMMFENEAKEPLVNYHERLLTREGYISAILVSDPAEREANRVTLDTKIMPKLQVNEGKRYVDFIEGTDKVSEYGLSALVLGGAGLAVAKKAGLIGLIAAFGKKFIFIVIAAVGGIFALIKKMLTRKKESAIPTGTDDQSSAS